MLEQAQAASHSNPGRRIIGFDTILLLILGVISLEINIPYALDQLDFHHAMPLFKGLANIFAPGGADNPLVIMGHLFTPLKLMIRTLTLGLLILYLLADLTGGRTARIKPAILIACILLHVVLPQTLLIRARVAAGNHALAHDGGTIQMEESMKMLLRGRNPYAETFENTPLENWRGFKNNVVYHVPYMPGAFLYPLPFYKLWNTLFGWYDQRIFYLLCFICAAGFLWASVTAWEPKAVALILLAFNPMFTRFFLLGSNDIFPLSLLAGSVWGLRRRRFTASYLFLGAACAVKQFAWFFVPFFLVYSLGGSDEKFHVRRLRSRQTWLPGLILAAATILPFVLWNPGAFIEDTYKYIAGGLPTSYPMQGFHGYGFATVLLFFRIIPDGNAAFPLCLIQIPFTVIPAIALWLKLARRPTLAGAVLYPTVVLTLYMFFSRYFHGNFVGFVLFWMVASWCFSKEEELTG